MWVLDPADRRAGRRGRGGGADRGAGGAGERRHDHRADGRAVLGRGRQPRLRAPRTATATIDWGDGTATSPGTIRRDATSSAARTPTPATGSYTGTITLTGRELHCGTGATDSFTANVAAGRQFTQCPAVYLDTGCQFLITVNNGTETVLQDANQGPYEGADDSLIGVQNNSSSPVSALPLSVPNSDLFGFEGDGICDPGGPPIPSGCVPQAGAPAGTVCEAQSTNCSFPAPPGEPAGYTEPGASGSGLPQNGYEGPTSWFSNVSTDESSGVVHFSPAIPPGGSTYFSLEEPPVGTSIGVGGTAPLPGAMSPPTVSSTGASFSALVNPNGQATTAYFQYGLDLKYSKFGGSGPNYTNSTADAVDRGRLQRPFRDRVRVRARPERALSRAAGGDQRQRHHVRA